MPYKNKNMQILSKSIDQHKSALLDHGCSAQQCLNSLQSLMCMAFILSLAAGKRMEWAVQARITTIPIPEASPDSLPCLPERCTHAIIVSMIHFAKISFLANGRAQSTPSLHPPVAS